MSRYGQCSDEELIERLRNGESKISDYLMEKYKGTVKKKSESHVPDRRRDRRSDTGRNDRAF